MASTTVTIDQAEAPLLALATDSTFLSANAATQFSMAETACNAWKQDALDYFEGCGLSAEDAANVWTALINFVVWIIQNFFNLLKRAGELIRDKIKELIGECECADWTWGEDVPEGPL